MRPEPGHEPRLSGEALLTSGRFSCWRGGRLIRSRSSVEARASDLPSIRTMKLYHVPGSRSARVATCSS